MTVRKKTRWAVGLAVSAALLTGCAVLWNPFARPSLERSKVVVAPAAGVAAPGGKDDVLTILYSGDGGWSDLDEQLGTEFAAHGIPVVGIDSFKYFWRSRSPDVAAQQLDGMINQALAKWHKQRVWLVGFSFGADVLPSLIDRLPAATRARITQLVLLSPSRDINFEIQFEGYMTERGRFKALVKKVTEKFNTVPHYPAIPPLAALQNKPPVVCYYGLDEKDDSLCTESDLPAWVKVYGQPGGHHFDEGYIALAGQMLDGLPSSRLPATAATASHPTATP
jgi:type IV secretory pathway VirJ component